MVKLFAYQLRLAFWNRTFIGLLAVILFVGWSLLTESTILGVARTAPFSPWSFASYLAGVMPLTVVALLLLLREALSGRRNRVISLVDATPFSPVRHLLLKCAAASSAWLIMTLLAASLGMVMLFIWFGRSIPLGEWLLASAVVCIPPALLFAGLGLLACRVGFSLPLALLPLPLIMYGLPLPGAADLFGSHFFAEFPLTLGTLEPAFILPLSFWLYRLLYCGVGIAMLVWVAAQEKRKSQK